MKVLVAGGAGFIGSTVCSACEDAGIEAVVLDDLSTGRREFVGDRAFYEGDVADGDLLRRIVREHPDIEATVHAAALIVVPDSVADPLRYYRTNVAKTLSLVEHLVALDRPRLVFSSSAAIYRPGPDFTVDESSPFEPLSPYARTKAMVEEMLVDVCATTPLRALSLRYFNPIGADPRLRSGLQQPRPSHALGVLMRAQAEGEEFVVTGDDWGTRDGTGIRDYVHVWDLALAHVAALRRLDDLVADRRHLAIDLGTGRGTTVLELVAAYERVTGETVRLARAPRRPGDNAGAAPRAERAADLLGWRAERDVETGIRDSLAWLARRDEVIPPR